MKATPEFLKLIESYKEHPAQIITMGATFGSGSSGTITQAVDSSYDFLCEGFTAVAYADTTVTTRKAFIITSIISGSDKNLIVGAGLNSRIFADLDGPLRFPFLVGATQNLNVQITNSESASINVYLSFFGRCIRV